MAGETVQPVRMSDPAEGVFVWDVNLRFTSNYDLPEGVLEKAVIRCIKDSQTIKVQSVGRVVSLN